MADTKATALAAFTPVLTDILYGVDDPGGTPVSGKVTFQAVSDLVEGELQPALDAKAPLQVTVGTALGTTGTVDLDMAALTGTVQTIAATGAITFTTSNRAAGRTVTLVISEPGTLSRALTWPAWLVLGEALPTAVSNQTIMVSLVFTGTTDATGIAASATQVA